MYLVIGVSLSILGPVGMPTAGIVAFSIYPDIRTERLYSDFSISRSSLKANEEKHDESQCYSNLYSTVFNKIEAVTIRSKWKWNYIHDNAFDKLELRQLENSQLARVHSIEV